MPSPRAPRLAAACRELVPALQAATDGRRIVDWAERIVASDRWTSFNRYHETAATLVELYEQAGAAVEVHPIQTGTHGGTGRWVITEAADVASATVDIVGPGPERIVDYARNPWQVALWSGSTPPGGLALRLTVCDTHDERDRRDFRGQAVLTRSGLGGQGARWAAAGAAVVIHQSDVRNHPEATAWVSFGWGGVPHADGCARPVGLCVSRNLGERLRAKMAGGEVILRIEVDVRRYVGTHDLVCGLVRGAADPQDEVWVLAHDQEPGAVDNASGVALSVAIATALEGLIAAGRLPRPKRTIRLLNAFECYGYFHYAEHTPRLQPPLAGVVLDSLGLRPELCGRVLGWRASVPSSAQFVHLVGERFLRAALRAGKPGYRLVCKPFVPTSDNLLGDPKYGFPCPWLETWDHGGRPYDAYHSSADTAALLDPRCLATVAVGMAGYLHYLADAETADALELAGLETAACRRELAADGLAPGRHEYLRERQFASLTRLRRWLWGGDTAAAAAALDALAIEPEPRRRRAAATPLRCVPRRTAFLAPTLENLPAPAARRLRASGLREWALFWADGERDLAAIGERIAAETGHRPAAEALRGHFETLAELGYVELHEAERIVDRARLVRDLRALGLPTGADVMVHASLSSLGHVMGGAATVVAALRTVVGGRGTLLMPSFHHFAAEVYNPATTPTLNGALADWFWRQPGVLRSDHPSHAVAASGPRAAWYLDGHAAAGAWSAESPIGRLVQRDGWVLCLGVDHTTTTAYHVAEAALGVPCLDPFGSLDRVVAADGTVRDVPGLAWRAGECPVPAGRINDELDAGGPQRRGMVGEAECRLVPVRHVVQARRRHLEGSCERCGIRPLPRGR